MTASTGWGVDEDARDVDFFLRRRNPVFLRAPNLSQTLDVYNVEGRFGATAAVERTPARASHLRADLDPGGWRCSGCSPTTSATSTAATTTTSAPSSCGSASGVVDPERPLAARAPAARWAAAWPTTGTVSPRAAGPISIRSTSAPPSRAPRAGRWGGALDARRRGSSPAWPAAATSAGQAAADLPPGRRSAGAARQPVPPLARLAAGGRATSATSSPAAAACAASTRGCRPRRSWRSTSSSSAPWWPGPRRGCSAGSRSRRSPTWRTAIGGTRQPRIRRPASGFLGDAGRRAPRGASHRGHAVRRRGSTCRCGSAGRSWRRTASAGDDEFAFRWVFSFQPEL